jgi:hypothetical protein
LGAQEYKSTVQLQGLHRKACHMSLRSGYAKDKLLVQGAVIGI